MPSQVSVKGCHIATLATRDIPCGAEVLVSYGEEYWLSRSDHEGGGMMSGGGVMSATDVGVPTPKRRPRYTQRKRRAVNKV